MATPVNAELLTLQANLIDLYMRLRRQSIQTNNMKNYNGLKALQSEVGIAMFSPSLSIVQSAYNKVVAFV